jgi:hypothetical protein
LETFIFHDLKGNFIEVRMGAASDFAIQSKAKELHSAYIGYRTDSEHYFTPQGNPTSLSELQRNNQPIPSDYPSIEEPSSSTVPLDVKIAQIKAQELLQNSALRDFGVIGQGLTYAPEAAAMVFLPELILGKIAAYYTKFSEGAAVATDYLNLFKTTSELDPVVTLYRGTTGSETSGSILFATDDATVAASYIQNGGQVVKYELSASSIKALEYTGELTYKTGMNTFTNQVTKEFVFEGQALKDALNLIAKPVE